jgi:voltage-gated potassium channel
LKTFKSLVRGFASTLLALQRSESKFVWVLIAVFVLVVVNPLLPEQAAGKYIFNLLLSFIILTGILAASDERQIIRQLTFMGLALMSLDWVITLAARQLPGMEFTVYTLYLLFVIAVTVAILLGVVRSQIVNYNIICGAVAAYLMIGLSGGFIALLIETQLPGSFLIEGELLPRQGLANSLIYFSMVSLSTIGYGDITPAAPIARSASLAVGLIGQIYLTVLVAILISKFFKD